MATVTDTGAVTASTTNADTYASASFAPAASDLLVVLVVAATTVDAGAITVSANGVTSMTRVDRAAFSTSTHSTYIFVADQLTTGTASMTVTFDCTGDTGAGAIVMVARVSGMTKTGATAIKQFITVNNGLGGTIPAFAFPSNCLTDNPTLVVLGQVSSAGSVPPSGWTEAVDTSFATPTIGGTYVFRDSGFTGMLITWGDTETAHGGVAVELDASGSGTTPVSTTRDATWDVLAQVDASRSTTWDVLASVSAARTTTWDVRAEVSASRVASWDVLATLAADRVATWDTLAAITATREASWDTRATVTATRSTTWDVLSSLVSVSTTRAASWNVRAQVATTREATWDTRAVVETSRATTWRVLEAITAARVASWRTLATATAARVASWRTLASITASRSTTWNVSSDVVIVTPPERIAYTAAEPRVLAVSAEERVSYIATEPRVSAASTEDRTAYVDAENRIVGGD